MPFKRILYSSAELLCFSMDPFHFKIACLCLNRWPHPLLTVKQIAFIFLMCAYTHTYYTHPSIQPVYFIQWPYWEWKCCGAQWHFVQWNEIQREESAGDTLQQGTTQLGSSHLSPLTAALRVQGLQRRFCCRWDPCLWELSRLLWLLATLKHPKFFILDTILFLLCFLGCKSNQRLSPVTDALTELRVKPGSSCW